MQIFTGGPGSPWDPFSPEPPGRPCGQIIQYRVIYSNSLSTKKARVLGRLMVLFFPSSSTLEAMLDFQQKEPNWPFYSCVLSYLAKNASEAGGDLALIQTSLLFSRKCQLFSIRTT